MYPILPQGHVLTGFFILLPCWWHSPHPLVSRLIIPACLSGISSWMAAHHLKPKPQQDQAAVPYPVSPWRCILMSRACQLSGELWIHTNRQHTQPHCGSGQQDFLLSSGEFLLLLSGGSGQLHPRWRGRTGACLVIDPSKSEPITDSAELKMNRT